VLYWFRTPPHVRVGRAALDEDAIRAIEASNPDIEFDWTRLLKERSVAPPPAERTGRVRRDRDGRRRRVERVRSGSPVEPATEPTLAAPPTPEPPGLPPGLHVEERLGTEGFSRLQARYAELMTRISERVTDAARLEELRAQAERLNPDTWITDAEARAGIEGFDEAYDALRAQLGQRKRRSRRGGRRRRPRAARGSDEGVAAPSEEPPGRDGPDADEGNANGGPDEPEPSA